MKKSELKQIIREELEKELSRRDKEVKNKYMEGEEILWKGTKVKVVKDEGEDTLTVIKPNGKKGMILRKDIPLPLNESPYPLTTRKHLIFLMKNLNHILKWVQLILFKMVTQVNHI